VKGIIITFFSVLLIAVVSCEIEPEQYNCLPSKVTRTIADGTNATSIIADFKYEGDQLGHIVYSNFQTHYYTYNSSGSLEKISRKNVQRYEKLESCMVYEDELLVRTDEYRITLDNFTQQEKDTSLIGYREFEYDGNKPVAETVVKLNESTKSLETTEYKLYTYDGLGNLTEYVSMRDIRGDTLEAYSYVYDNHANPFAALNLVFEGETYVNNVLEKHDMLTGEVYFYQMLYSATDYPTQINIKEDTYLVEVIRVDYRCE
jgi:hypothetical protein